MDESSNIVPSSKRKNRQSSGKIPSENSLFPETQVNSKKDHGPHSLHEFPLTGASRALSPHRREYSYVSQAMVTTDLQFRIKVANDQFLRLFQCNSAHNSNLIEFFDDKSTIEEYLANYSQLSRQLVRMKHPNRIRSFVFQMEFEKKEDETPYIIWLFECVKSYKLKIFKDGRLSGDCSAFSLNCFETNMEAFNDLKSKKQNAFCLLNSSGKPFPVTKVEIDSNCIEISTFVNLSNRLVIDKEGIIRRINPVFSKLFLGYKDEEIIGNHVSLILPLLTDFVNNENLNGRVKHKDGSDLDCILRIFDEITHVNLEITAKDPFTDTHEVPCKTDSLLSKNSEESLNQFIVKDLVRETCYNPERRISDYDIISQIGEGAYGFVYKQQLKKSSDSSIKIIKHIFKSRILLESWQRSVEDAGPIPEEIFILDYLKQFNHPNIVCIEEYFQDQKFFYLVMPLFGDGIDLFDFIEKYSSLDESKIRFIFKQIVEAVSFLHEKGIVHRDIKDENIILNVNSEAKLIDFGSSAFIKEKKFSTFYGTLDYAVGYVFK